MKNLIISVLLFFAATINGWAQNQKNADYVFEQAGREYDRKEYESAYLFASEFIKEETKQSEPRILKLDDAYRMVFFINFKIKNLKYSDFIKMSNDHLNIGERKKYQNLPVVDVINFAVGLKNFEVRDDHILLLDRMIFMMKQYNPDDTETLKLLISEKENCLRKLSATN